MKSADYFRRISAFFCIFSLNEILYILRLLFCAFLDSLFLRINTETARAVLVELSHGINVIDAFLGKEIKIA